MTRSIDPHPFVLTAVSFALLLIIALLAATPSSPLEDVPDRRPIAGFLFAALLLSGMGAALWPQACSGPLHPSREAVRPRGSSLDADRGRTVSSVFGLRIVHGHHPSCQGFSRHEFQVGDRSFCVSCMGLLAGATLALAFTLGLFLSDWQLGEPELFLSLGIATVALGLLQYVGLDDEPRLLRFSLNAFFVFGAFLVLASVETLTESLAVDLLVVASSLVWLGARISLSRWRHDRICSACGFRCEG